MTQKSSKIQNFDAVIYKNDNNRWFSAVLLCIYGDNHARVVPYFESRMVPLGILDDFVS